MATCPSYVQKALKGVQKAFASRRASCRTVTIWPLVPKKTKAGNNKHPIQQNLASVCLVLQKFRGGRYGRPVGRVSSLPSEIDASEIDATYSPEVIPGANQASVG